MNKVKANLIRSEVDCLVEELYRSGNTTINAKQIVNIMDFVRQRKLSTLSFHRDSEENDSEYMVVANYPLPDGHFLEVIIDWGHYLSNGEIDTRVNRRNVSSYITAIIVDFSRQADDYGQYIVQAK